LACSSEIIRIKKASLYRRCFVYMRVVFTSTYDTRISPLFTNGQLITIKPFKSFRPTEI